MLLTGLVAVTAPGCAWKSIDAGCANVPTPVLLSNVDRIQGHKAVETASLGKVDVEVAETKTATSRNEGNYTVTTVHTTREGANKASFAVMAVTGGKKDVDVHVEKASAGAYVMAPLFFVRTKTWVGVEGNAASGGGR